LTLPLGPESPGGWPGEGYAAAVVVAAFEGEGVYRIDGVTVLPCPQQTRGVTCRDCGLCRDDQRLRSARLVIAFQAHQDWYGCWARPFGCRRGAG
jgi:hypothetical protein